MLAADASMVILRVVHIVTGVIWVGSLFVVVVFVQPSAAALGPAVAPFMSKLRRRRFVDVVFIDALLTIGAGRSSTGTTGTRIRASATGFRSNFGAALTVGALLAILGDTSSPGWSRVPPSVGSFPSESRSLCQAERPHPSWPRGSAGSSAGWWWPSV